MLTGRLPWSSRLNREGDAATQRNGTIYGDHGVRFNDDGRPLFPGQRAGRPSGGNLLFWRRDGDRDNRPAQPQPAPVPVIDTHRYRPYSRTTIPAQRAQQVRAAPFVTRRFDAPTTYETTTRVTTMRPEVIVVEEMKIYDEKPCMWWLFILLGIIMFILGILNIIWCWEYHWYSRFWAAILLFLFGIAGGFHRGDYIDIKLRSILYILLGVVTTLAVTAACAAVLSTLAHQVIEITQYGYSQYLGIQEFRYEFAQFSPVANLTNWDYNITVCLGLDSLQLLLTMVGFAVLTSTIYILDRYFNSHYVIRRMVEPFCEPWLFNPWGQSSLGQAQIFIGLVLLYSVHGTLEYPWQTTGAPIWAGIIPVFAGIVAALCLKACDPDRAILNFVAIVLEILSIIGSVVAIVLVTFGLADNIRNLQQTTNVMILTEWPVQMMVASSVLFAISDMSCIVNVFYSLSLLFRIFFCVCTDCCGRDLTSEEFRIVDDSSDTFIEETYKTYDEREYPPRHSEIGRFDPFRPAATRSFYVR